MVANMARLSLFVVMLPLFVGVFAQDPCTVYRNISQDTRGRRSTGYDLSSGENPICDRFTVTNGHYYRFVHPDRLCEEIPSGPVEHFKCGTVFPMYFLTPPDPNLSNQTLTVCGDVYSICSQNDTIEMIKCPDTSSSGLDFYVYKLRDPGYCDMAYCAGTLPKKCDCDTYVQTLTPGAPPAVTSLANQGLCDFNVSDCSQVELTVSNMNQYRCLRCAITEFTVFPDGSLTINETNTRTVNAKYRAPDKVECLLNEDVQPSARHASIPKLSGMVSVSQDGKNFSVRLPFASYDSTCQQCQGNTPLNLRCTVKPGTCSIDGNCYINQQVNPSKPCLICNPTHNQWGPKPGTTPPDLSQVPDIITKTAGHTTMHSLYHSPTFNYSIVTSSIPGVTLTPQGQLTIPGCDADSADPHKTRSILIQAINDCAATSQKTISVQFETSEQLPGWALGLIISFSVLFVITFVSTVILAVLLCKSKKNKIRDSRTNLQTPATVTVNAIQMVAPPPYVSHTDVQTDVPTDTKHHIQNTN